MSTHPDEKPSRPPVWIPLASAADPAQVGGKAANLRRCILAGWPVPPGGVVTIDAHLRILAGEIDLTALGVAVARQLASFQPDQVFAVRSSAEVEDSASASFAGQFKSVLNVRQDDLPTAIMDVQGSVRNPAALRYARRLRVQAPNALAVIVQCQVNARLAGVCFTRDPVTGADDVLVEYTAGIGEAVVGGLALAADSCRFQRAPGGAVVTADTGPHIGDATQVAEMAIALEATFGGPQDVEWAYDAHRLWLLQTRPITAAGGTRPGGDAANQQSERGTTE